MAITTKCFSVESYHQANKVISICKTNKIYPVLFIKYFLINSFGIDWLKELSKALIKNFSSKSFKIYVDCKNNYGLSIALIEISTNYIKVDADKKTIKKLKQISNLKKVLINPKFSIVDLSKIKNLELKIKKTIM